jgi:acylphosphatase
MIRSRIVVRGNVQKVGYRDFVQDIARELDVRGYVKNLKDGNVEIVCECDERILHDFSNRINVRKDFINVKGVEIVERSKATGEFKYFDIKYGKLEEEIGERMVAGVKYASATLKETKEGRRDMKAMHRDLKMEEKKTRESIKDVHGDVNERFDWMADRYGDFGKIMKSLDEKVDSMDKSIEGMENSFTKLVNHIIGRDKG